MNDDLYNDDEKYDRNLDRQPSDVSIVDQEKSWAELQSQLYSQEAEKIADSKWRQLRCKTTTLTYSVTWVKCIYIMVAVICIPIGVITYNLSQSVVIQEFPAYDSIADCSIDEGSQQIYGKECKINYTLEYDFNPPIYFHYKLTNFYQNHRSYVKSRSENQLKNEDITDVEDCDPEQVQYSQTVDYNNKKMLPCGLIANSFFNDKYKVTYYKMGNVDNTAVEKIEFCNTTQCDADEQDPNTLWSEATWYAVPNWDNTEIAWKSDVEGKFASTEQTEQTTDINEIQENQDITLPGTDDYDFIVWMRTATVSEFTKLHRIINGQSLKKGDILEVTIKNYFRVSPFDGTKSLVITTNSSLGGRNNVLGICFMVIGSLSLITAVCFRLLIPPKRDSPYSD